MWERGSGQRGEAIAAHYLILQGISILQRNVQVADVEVDIVAREASCLILVEVKLRRGPMQPAREGIGAQQERRLLRAASTLLQRTGWAESVRLDVIGIDVEPAAGRLHLEHLRGALPRRGGRWP